MGPKASRFSLDESKSGEKLQTDGVNAETLNRRSLRWLEDLVTGNKWVFPKCVAAQFLVTCFCEMKLLTNDVAHLIVQYCYNLLSKENEGRKNLRLDTRANGFQTKLFAFPMEFLCQWPNAIIMALQGDLEDCDIELGYVGFELNPRSVHLVQVSLLVNGRKGTHVVGLNCAELFNEITPKSLAMREAANNPDQVLHTLANGLVLRTKATLLFLCEHVYLMSRQSL